MRHRSFITALTLLVVLMIISCSLGARLSTPTATTLPAAPIDSDGDRVPDADDNCPITPNPDQADADANGLGDPCDTPFLNGFAYLTPQGVVQSSVDERLRPAKIVAPDGTITFVWSEDASRVDLIVEAAGESKTFTLDIDLSDAALLAALDAAEAETGQDLSALRAWIAENPGLVLAVARGEQPPPRLAPTPGSSLPAGISLLAIANPAVQDQQTDVDDYLVSLAIASDDADAVWDYIVRLTLESFDADAVWKNFLDAPYEGDPEEWERTKNILFDNMMYRSMLQTDQVDNCLISCNHHCAIDCGSGQGACFTMFPMISPCHESNEQECGRVSGVFYLGQTCPGACWISAGGLTDCQETDKETCRLIPERSAGNPTTRFCPGQACSEPMCSQPVP